MQKTNTVLIRNNPYSPPIRQTFLSLNLTSKFRTIYIIIIALCIFCNTFVVHFFYTYETKKTISGLAAQALDNILQNVDSSIYSASKVSTYVLSNTTVQNYLLGSTTGSNGSIDERNLRNTLYLSLETIPLASSIIVIDPTGQYQCAGRYTLPHIKLSHPQEASWYEKVHELKGTPLYMINGGGYFSVPEGEDCLSIIRLVNSTETAMPLGYMLINIPLSSLFNFEGNAGKTSSSDICVLSSDAVILPFSSHTLQNYLSTMDLSSIPDSQNMTLGGKRYLMQSRKDAYLDWQYISTTEYSSYSADVMPFLWIFLFTMAISAGLFLLIALCTSRFITAPLNKLTNAMQKTEQGNFKKAYVTNNKDEIGFLQDAYNEMVDKIQALLESKVLEQKRLRKSELKVMQEQMKPHFLYNSLNGIAYLIQSQQNEAASNLVIALSEYYRESLSKGSEVIPLSTEVNIVKNYLELQKMRFPDTLEDIYDIAEDTLDIQMPRLVLQPLVENALYHGILPTGDYGTISIGTWLEDQHFIIHVKDDGMGMDEELLQNILEGKLEKNRESFGLRRTVERLQIFYDKKDIYQIQSSPDEGTDIIFKLPIKPMEVLNEP